MTISLPRLRAPRPRRAAVTSGVALAALAAPLLATLPGPAQAAEVTTTVQFAGCEVRHMPYATNTQVGGETTWSPSLTFAMPTPIPSGDEVTVDVELGDLPANTLPEDMVDVTVYVWRLELVNEHEGALAFYDNFHVPNLDSSQPLPFPALENDTAYWTPGTYHHKVKSVLVYFTGEDTNGAFSEYSFECDQVVNPQPILTTAVYDLSATSTLSLDRASANVGQTVAFAGTNLLTAAPAMPRAQASVTVGGVPSGNVEVDDSGAVHGTFSVPAGLSGTVEVRVGNGAKSASQPLVISTAPGAGPGGVDINNPATWHPNAQSGVVDKQAKVKVATKKVRSGKKLKLGGSGFAPGEAVIVKAKGKKSKVFTKVVYANAAGAIKATVKLKGAAKGKWGATAIGVASGRGGAAKFKVK